MQKPLNNTAQEVKTCCSMTTPQNPPSGATLAEEFEAALEWWKAAGVDHDFSDDATDWLAPAQVASDGSDTTPIPAKPKRVIPTPPPPKKIGGAQENWPNELNAFHDWWVTSPDIDDGGSFAPVKPRGTANAALMIVVAEPEENDTDMLLSGPQGRLLANMLRAMGMDADKVYIASVLRRHTPMPDWAALREAGLGDLVMHHIRIAAPQRILTFGRNIPPLLGNDTAQGAAFSHNINHDGRSIPVMGVGSLPELLRSPPRRQRFWRNWLEWIDS